MKRSLIERQFDSLSVANCLMLLSRRTQHESMDESISTSRVFECKTCNRQFPSFQALGGHRASHKKPRLATSGDENSRTYPVKPKTHECSICGLEFPIGQALGGHMRRHRAAAMNDSNNTTSTTPPPPLNLLPPHPTHHQVLPVVKKSNSRGVLCLDLNLTPVENDLEIRLGKPIAPVINCYI